MTTQSHKLVLASGSPRRAELLRQLGLVFDVLRPEIDESVYPEEPVDHYVRRMAKEKSAEALRVLDDVGGVVVVSADTVVAVADRIMGKPRDEEDAVGMLMALSGRTHRVVTAVTIVSGQQQTTLCHETLVTFRHVGELECRAYWMTGEPEDKAGAYGIQGWGAIFVKSIQGSYSNVVGLPLMETAEVLKSFGIDCLRNAIRQQARAES
jgi:septum formation protein